METPRSDSEVSGHRFGQPVGEAEYGLESGLVGELNLLARTRMPVSEGVVLTRESHQEFMETSGLLQSIRASIRKGEDVRWLAREAQLRYGSAPIEGQLNRAICDALIGLGALMVALISEDLTERLGEYP